MSYVVHCQAQVMPSCTQEDRHDQSRARHFTKKKWFDNHEDNANLVTKSCRKANCHVSPLPFMSSAIAFAIVLSSHHRQGTVT